MPGRGGLSLDPIVAGLVANGYRGWFEFEVVGEAAEAAGYEETLRELREVADHWSRMHPTPVARERLRVDATIPR